MEKKRKNPRALVLEKAIEDARKTQEYYLAQVQKVNETLAKYTRKMDELEKGSK